jgi:hypothetical protein
MSPADFLFFSLQHMLTEPVACELQRRATIALALFMRPFDRCASNFIIPLWFHLMFYTEPSNGFLHNLKVKLLKLLKMAQCWLSLSASPRLCVNK